MKNLRKQPRGVAIVIVLVMVALATIMAAALLSSQSTMVQASDNGLRAAQADALAESGIQLASYYLQNPSAAPVLNSSGFYPGQTGVSLGSAAGGTVDITVTKVDNTTFDISAKSHYGTTSASPMTRSLGARAAVQYAYTPADASAVNGSFTASSNTSIVGNIRASGTVTLSLGSKVTGTITAPSVVGSLLNFVGSILSPPNGSGGSNPVTTTIQDYKTYTYNGKKYKAQDLKVDAGTLGPSKGNPLGVFFKDGDTTISKPLTVNGTVLVRNGKLILKSSSTTAISLTVNPPTGMPGLIVNSDVRFSGTKGTTLTVNGLTWIGGVITNSGTTSNNKISLNGSAQFAGSNAVTSSYVGSVSIYYDKNKATAAGFLPGQGTTIANVSLTSFSNSGSK